MKGMYTGRTYVSVEIEFDTAWNELSEKEQHDIVLDNLGLLEDAELTSELESRGYTCKEKGE